MKKFLASVTALALLGVSSSAFAACPNGGKLRKIGNIISGSSAFGVGATASGGTVTTASADVHMIILNCSGTACTTQIANVDNIGSASSGDVVMDPGAAANATLVIDLTESPLSFSAGISVGDTTTNTSSIGFYSCDGVSR